MSKRELTDTVSTALAMLAIVLQILLVLVVILALAALVSGHARRALNWLRETLFGAELWMAWTVALVAMLGSLYFSEIANFIPCRLCWLQRIAMYPLVAILLVAAVRRDVRGGFLYAIPLPVIGAMVSIWHIYIENHPEAESAKCKIGASCATKWIDKFGYITIPTLALTAFATIVTLLLFAWSRRNAQDPFELRDSAGLG